MPEFMLDTIHILFQGTLVTICNVVLVKNLSSGPKAYLAFNPTPTIFQECHLVWLLGIFRPQSLLLFGCKSLTHRVVIRIILSIGLDT